MPPITPPTMAGSNHFFFIITSPFLLTPSTNLRSDIPTILAWPPASRNGISQPTCPARCPGDGRDEQMLHFALPLPCPTSYSDVTDISLS